MGKGRTRAVEKGVVGQSGSAVSSGSLNNIPLGPVYYPTEDEFKDLLEFIYKIRPEAEPYGICRIVPPKTWKPPFALNLDSFTFPTKTQAIHQLQVRPAACDSKTFDLEYNRFLEKSCGKKAKKRIVFEGEDLDFCKLFNAVKRYGGYDEVVKRKKWGEVSKFLMSGRKVSDCAKHVLSLLYLEHLYDYEIYYNGLNKELAKSCRKGVNYERKNEQGAQSSASKRRNRNKEGVGVKEEEHDQICEQCKSGLHGEVMLLCDRCDKGWHIYCLSPPLKQVPSGNWYCFECLNSDKDSFGFVPGKHYTLEAFGRMADRFQKKWFGSGHVSRVQVERKFWEIVEGSLGEVEVMYGSDLDTSQLGSGFPRITDHRPQSIDVKIWNEYCASPWNLNNLPKLKGSVLESVHHNITGVMVPWLYIGMLFSSFCWHFEDHCFYSMNYLHWGEPKCWYSIPGSQAEAFEKVMRSSLPDLFDAQPDLLFQLVTMLNPSVLQENGVPVYSILQEPGNFVVTFPRSYHGGFNLGFNCAEAVNFAPADWLPHGAFGAELYKQYHKAAVLSHEELLCVVAKSACNSRLCNYLKKELLQIYANEKAWREKLWKNGIRQSSCMSPRNCPQYVGTEEDPTCIICHQYLYLSAIVCRCRPSIFVCLEHWEHLCECEPTSLRLLYRHSLAELYDLVLSVEKYTNEEKVLSRNTSKQFSSCEAGALMKKVKGGHVTLAKLASQWLRHCSEILQNPFSTDAYTAALREAEQFLWAGPEMDPVRDMMKNLAVAQKWAEGIKGCLSGIANLPSHGGAHLEKVRFDYVTELLLLNPLPCNEPAYKQLKAIAEDVTVLVQEIRRALSESSNIPKLENLYSRSCELPFCLTENEELSNKISSLKSCLENVKRCVSIKHPHLISFDVLCEVKLQMSKLQLKLPETEFLLNLLHKAESCRIQCGELMSGPMYMKDVEVLLQEWEGFAVDIPELRLLWQYHTDAVSWLSQFKGILQHARERENQQKIIDELSCILKEGNSLKIKVDELPLVEVELKKACCREKALRAHDCKMPLEFIQRLIRQAEELHIEGEKPFVHWSGVLAVALNWEARARDTLSHRASLSEFNDIIGASENILVILPSLGDIMDAMSEANSWLNNSKTFLDFPAPALSSSRKVEELQILVSQSKLLKVTLEEGALLEMILKSCKGWEEDAHSALQDTDCLLNLNITASEISNCLVPKISILISRIESIRSSGMSLGFDFHEMPKLQNAHSILWWCNEVLSFCTICPSLEDVLSLLKDVERLSSDYTSTALLNYLVEGVKWVHHVLEIIPAPRNFRRSKLSEVEDVLANSQRFAVSFTAVICRLENDILKHKFWKEQVCHFLDLSSRDCSWPSILKLKEDGNSVAFECSELKWVISEVEKVENWRNRCSVTIGISVGDEYTLLDALEKIKLSLDRSLSMYEMVEEEKARNVCSCCSNNLLDQKFLACSTCKDCYHLHCHGSAAADANIDIFICPYCKISGSSPYQVGFGPLSFGPRRAELDTLQELLSDAKHFCVWIEERDALNKLVEQALSCQSCLKKIVDLAATNLGEDIDIISQKLTVAMKAVDVAGVCSSNDNCELQLASARNSWRVQVKRLLGGLQKPYIEQIQMHLEEGQNLQIRPEDCYIRKLVKFKSMGLEWTEKARQVSTDSETLDLESVFELIEQGQRLPVCVHKEIKLLRSRSMLHCICRKPYDRKGMTSCDQCDEWYHLECMGLQCRPDVYICPACEPEKERSCPSSHDHERLNIGRFVEPRTPSPLHAESRKRQKRSEPCVTGKVAMTKDHRNVTCPSGIEKLWWRNRKPFRRTAKRRLELQSLSPFFCIQQ